MKTAHVSDPMIELGLPPFEILAVPGKEKGFGSSLHHFQRYTYTFQANFFHHSTIVTDRLFGEHYSNKAEVTLKDPATTVLIAP